MTERSRILVTGATGNVGREVVSEAMDTGRTVRALVRNPDTADLPEGVEVTRGDLSNPGTLESALGGVDAVFLVWPFLTTETAPAVVGAFEKHARRVVYLSSSGVRDGVNKQPDPINQFHSEIERIIEESDLEWTFLRSGGLAVNALGWVEQIRAEGVVREPFKDAVRSLIHERDIAAVAVRALTGDGHTGKKYVLTGPETLTTAEQVRIIGEEIGHPLRFEEAPAEKTRAAWISEGLPPEVVDGILAAHAEFAANPEPVTATVEEVTGTPAHTFRGWANDHADDFR